MSNNQSDWNAIVAEAEQAAKHIIGINDGTHIGFEDMADIAEYIGQMNDRTRCIMLLAEVMVMQPGLMKSVS